VINGFEVVFSRRCVPPSRFIRADRYEIKPPNGITTTEEEIVFYRGDNIVERESVYDVKEIREVTS
jgi:hypothetical protein